MQWNKDLSVGGGSKPFSNFDVKRYSQQRAQQLPLGGLLGERVAKSISLYDEKRDFEIVNRDYADKPDQRNLGAPAPSKRTQSKSQRPEYGSATPENEPETS